ncbi:MAG: hypothetical protein HFI62_09190 [Lachnospiraceae bacterium]|nr:hypothetical protein [Lachnospiraceae bacterium]
MSATEIVMIIIGAGVFLLGYLMPARKKDADEGVQLISEAEVRRMVEAEVKDTRERIADIVDETISYSIEKTERAMERVANEKIMAVNEYSDTVLEEINKNHKEVIFLYDMLNDKHDNLMLTINEATQAADEIKQTVKDAEITAVEAARKVKDAEDAAEAAILKIQDAEATAREAKEAVQEAVESVMGAVQDTRTDLWSLHSTKEYHQDVLDEVQELVDDDVVESETVNSVVQEEVQAATGPMVETEPEETEFMPIKPKRVEIIHEPDGDYVAPQQDISTSEAFASLGIFGTKQEEAEEPRRKTKARRGFRKETASEDVRGVEIQFAKGKDNGRNSNERILELHKAGKSNMAIAKELGLGLGEVKLVIDLFEGM